MDPPDSGPSKCLVGYLRPSASTSDRTTVDLSHSAEDEQFRSDVREWLGDNLVGDFADLKGLGGSGKEARTSVGSGKSVSERVDSGGLPIIQNTKQSKIVEDRTRNII